MELPDNPPLPPCRGRRRVVLVDDNDLVLQLLKTMLIRAHPELVLEVFSSSRDALTHLESHDHAVLVTDFHMPVVDGLTLVAAAKRRQPEIQSIVVTGDPDNGIVQRALAAGVYDLLKKPLDCQDVTAVVLEALELHRLARRQKADHLRLERWRARLTEPEKSAGHSGAPPCGGRTSGRRTADGKDGRGIGADEIRRRLESLTAAVRAREVERDAAYARAEQRLRQRVRGDR
ncbi:response regulator transcription factor [Candidatus Nitrospira bockiana]